MARFLQQQNNNNFMIFFFQNVIKIIFSMSVCSREHYKQQENNKVVMKIPNVLGKSSSMVTYTKTDGNIFATTKRQQFRRLLFFSTKTRRYIRSRDK